MRLLLSICILMFSFVSMANDKVRPGPHNKIGHSKQAQEGKEDTFIYKLFNNELDFMSSNSSSNETSINNDQALSQIEKLADLKERGIITEAEFNDKKKVLLDKIQ
jgi:hypothetical protein